MSAIEFNQVSKQFGTVSALHRLDVTVARGRVTGFVGPNGSGKTTSMRILLGLAYPTSGTATFAGRTYRELIDPIRHIGAALTADTFHPSRSAREHLLVIATAAGLPHPRVDEVLGQVGLADVARRNVGGYSLGMRQRLALAGALIGDPAVLVLDEPLNGLDPDGVVEMRNRIRGFADDGRTVLLSSHLLGELARVADDLIVIAAGRLRAAAPLAELIPAPRTIIRTAHADVLTTALLAAGHAARRTGEDTVTVTGADAERVGRLAAQEGAVVLGLSEEHDDLEQLFHRLTGAESIDPATDQTTTTTNPAAPAGARS